MLETQKKKIDDDIKIIIDYVLDATREKVLSIILYGSYGRDEGAFYADQKGVIHTYNDYDLILVVDDYIESIKLNQIAHSLEEKLDVKWIDISQKKKNKLKNLKLTIFNYDLKYGSRIIYGEKEILNNVPKFKNNEISLKEVETLYFTRIWAFLGSLTHDGFKRKLNRNESRFFRYQMAKAILAVVDVLLLQQGKYQTSYRKRVQIINEIYNKDSNIVKWSNWAISEKCNPRDDVMSINELKEMYINIASFFVQEMYIGLAIYYKREIKSALDIENALLRSGSDWFVFIKTVVKTRSLSHLKRTKIKLAQAYLLDFFIMEGADKARSKEKVINLLKGFDASINKNNFDWHKLRLMVSQLRMKI